MTLKMTWFLSLKMIIFGHFSRFLASFKISFSCFQHPFNISQISLKEWIKIYFNFHSRSADLSSSAVQIVFFICRLQSPCHWLHVHNLGHLIYISWHMHNANWNLYIWANCIMRHNFFSVGWRQMWFWSFMNLIAVCYWF